MPFLIPLLYTASGALAGAYVEAKKTNSELKNALNGGISETKLIMYGVAGLVTYLGLKKFGLIK